MKDKKAKKTPLTKSEAARLGAAKSPWKHQPGCVTTRARKMFIANDDRRKDQEDTAK